MGSLVQEVKRWAIEELDLPPQSLPHDSYIKTQWSHYEQSRLRELMLDSFRLRCTEEREVLTCDTQTISSQRQAVQQLSRKAEVKVVFGGSDDRDGDGDTAAEPLVLRNVRDLCRERVFFFQSLQDSMLKSSSSSEFTPEQRNAAYQHWLSAVEDVLRSHPPNQVLLALQALASKQQVALEEKTATLDVEHDISALGFQYVSNHLLDVSVEEEEDLPPVRSLLQVRNRAQRLHTDLSVLKKEVQQRILGQDDVVNPAMQSMLELELQVVRQVAMRDSMQEQCVQLQQENREKGEALRSLHTQWQNIMDFRQCVDTRQEQIRSLIRGNSSLKTELLRVHSESRQFMREKLSPQFEGVIRSANQLRNSVSQEAKLFHSVCLSALDRRTVNGERVALDQLSLSRLNSPALHGVRQSLDAPLFMAPELLFSQAASQRLQLRFLRRLLQLRTDSLTDIRNRTAQLPAPSQQALLQRVKMEDAELLQSLLPRVKELSLKCSEGVAYASQVNTAITHWWEQPAQFALPDMQQEGLNFQQWLQRWKRATKEL
ncbi:HAUS augmin-like complex subunit 5 [Bagarius yarrelli]|uniref:HAUS augmin-like complex subunit 5 n=1 Tax=Bagarius yarrelli TaxID=175774 RepID=A0A556VCI9_BAGYA|nr:HAUS augmin-like complex subunit 5 [Bagarius yarrelli]